MSERISIQSHKGNYLVLFGYPLLGLTEACCADKAHVLIDSNVARLYADRLEAILLQQNTIIIDATEDNKSIEHVIPIYERLVGRGIRRDHALIGMGGGIVQDITCFVASTLLRGLEWKFVPTTLLAQADSCIGSKSSINLGKTKNILGTFNPPSQILICTDFLETLEDKEMRSGIGEILKVHAIESAAAYDRLAVDFDVLRSDRGTLLGYVREALTIKRRYIEVDEFDRGVRNVFNYGHSFGHAIEAASEFAVPHGVAVTMGMDMANRVAVLRGLLPEQHYLRMHQTLRKNYAPFVQTHIPLDRLLGALWKDKKNTLNKLGLILPVGEEAKIKRVEVLPDEAFCGQCKLWLDEMKR